MAVYCLLLQASAAASVFAEQPACPLEDEKTILPYTTYSPTYSTVVPVTLLPCQRITLKFTFSVSPTNPNGSANANVQVKFYGKTASGADNQIYISPYFACQPSCTQIIPFGPNYVNPYPGTRGIEGLVQKMVFTISLGSGTASPAMFTLETTKSSRPFYNLGGVSFTEATEVGFGSKLRGSFHHTEPGQFFKIYNPGLAPLRFKGTASCAAGSNNSAFILTFHRADGTPILGLNQKTASCLGGSTPPSVNFDWTITPPQDTPPYLYFKLRAGTWPITDVVMTVDGDPSKTVLLRGVIDQGTLSPLPGETLPTIAHVPLGSRVRFEMWSGLATAVAAGFTVAVDKIELPDPSLRFQPSDPLFPNNVVFAFGEREPHAVTMMAVHKGTATVTVTPADSTILPRIFRIIVDAPEKLGTEATAPPGESIHSEVDNHVINVAHALGIAPQFIKAQIRQESKAAFNPLAWRYEPIGDTGDLFTISRHKNYRTDDTRFVPYRLATEADAEKPALPEGTNTTTADITVRAGLRVGCGSNGLGGVALTVFDDGPVSAYELLNCNRRQRWREMAGGEGAAHVQEVKDSDFTAQTSLAGSYGYMQVMYISVIDPGRGRPTWAGTLSGLKNPSALLDTDQNIAAGGGSVVLGTRKLAYHIRSPYRITANDPDNRFTNYDAYFAAVRYGWDRYNPGQADYEDLVARFVANFAPVPFASKPLF